MTRERSPATPPRSNAFGFTSYWPATFLCANYEKFLYQFRPAPSSLNARKLSSFTTANPVPFHRSCVRRQRSKPAEIFFFVFFFVFPIRRSFFRIIINELTKPRVVRRALNYYCFPTLYITRRRTSVFFTLGSFRSKTNAFRVSLTFLPPLPPRD